jgi:hypothetical protein
MAEEQPKTVQKQLEERAMDLWTSVKRVTMSPRESCSVVDQEELRKMSLESVVKVMFGSCTSAANPGMDDPQTSVPELSPRKSRSYSKSPDMGMDLDPDSLYRSLFSDNHLRAEEAVAHLREQLDQQRKAAAHKSASGKGVPGVFHVSTPTRKAAAERAPPAAELLEDSAADLSKSFEDGISVITQYTLDLIIADREGPELHRVHSDLTQDPIEEVEESWKQTIRPSRFSSSPLRMGRSSNRSHCTAHTKRSQETKGTKSTQSSNTHEFADVWQREEQKYWNEVVKEEDGGFEAEERTVSALHHQKKFFRARELTRKARFLSSNRSSADVSTFLFVLSHAFWLRGSLFCTCFSSFPNEMVLLQPRNQPFSRGRILIPNSSRCLPVWMSMVDSSMFIYYHQVEQRLGQRLVRFKGEQGRRFGSVCLL